MDTSLNILLQTGVTNEELGRLLNLSETQARRQLLKAEAAFFGQLIQLRPAVLRSLDDENQRILVKFYRIRWNPESTVVELGKPAGVCAGTLAKYLELTDGEQVTDEQKSDNEQETAETRAWNLMLTARACFLCALGRDCC